MTTADISQVIDGKTISSTFIQQKVLHETCFQLIIEYCTSSLFVCTMSTQVLQYPQSCSSYCSQMSCNIRLAVSSQFVHLDANTVSSHLVQQTMNCREHRLNLEEKCSKMAQDCILRLSILFITVWRSWSSVQWQLTNIILTV